MSSEKKKSMTFADREKVIEATKRYSLFDDTFLNVVLKNINACQYIINVLTERNDIKVIDVDTQPNIKNLSGRSVILDVLARDDAGKLYNIEFQKADNDNHRKRVRYYSALVDASFTPAGTTFSQIPDLISIYLMRKDFFKQGKTVYRVVKKLDDTGIEYDDGHTIIFANAECSDGSAISQLMQYFITADPDDCAHGELSKYVRYLKTDEGGYDIMCEITSQLIADSKVESLAAMLKDGMPEDDACRYLQIPEDMREEMLNKAKAKNSEQA